MHIHLGVPGGRGRLLARRRWDFVPEHRAVGRGRPSTDIVPLSLCPSAPTVQSRSPKSRQRRCLGVVFPAPRPSVLRELAKLSAARPKNLQKDLHHC